METPSILEHAQETRADLTGTRPTKTGQTNKASAEEPEEAVSVLVPSSGQEAVGSVPMDLTLSRVAVNPAEAFVLEVSACLLEEPQ